MESDREQALERMETERIEHNETVRNREYCINCHHSVRERDHPFKYIQAGGVLEGPFCSDTCHWRYLGFGGITV